MEKPFNLTPREHEIILLLARGFKREAVASELQISLGTLNTHLDRAYRKLGVHVACHAVAVVVQGYR